MIRTLDYRISALHIHDNDKMYDTHQISFSMDINFNEVDLALKEIKYKGYFTPEADRYLSVFTK